MNTEQTTAKETFSIIHAVSIVSLSAQPPSAICASFKGSLSSFQSNFSPGHYIVWPWMTGHWTDPAHARHHLRQKVENFDQILIIIWYYLEQIRHGFDPRNWQYEDYIEFIFNLCNTTSATRNWFESCDWRLKRNQTFTGNLLKNKIQQFPYSIENQMRNWEIRERICLCVHFVDALHLHRVLLNQGVDHVAPAWHRSKTWWSWWAGRWSRRLGSCCLLIMFHASGEVEWSYG